MKSFTDLEQSKKLAEFLHIESADMHYATWTILDGEFIVCQNQGSTIKSLQEDYGNQIIPCWSLAALLVVLDFPCLTQENENEWEVSVFDHDNDGYIEKTASNPIDACYEMILKLHELNLL